MKVVGLTGGIGSGKTTVAKVFATLGVPVFYSDEAGRRVLDEDPLVIEHVTHLLGKDVYHHGKADRKRIADRVFNDPQALSALNAIIHPAVRRRMQQWMKGLEPTTAYVIKEAAILFESGAHEQCDFVIAVHADQDLRIDRLIKRDGVTPEDVLSRMQHQWSSERIEGMSDAIIDNTGEKSVIHQVMAIHASLLTQFQ